LHVLKLLKNVQSEPKLNSFRYLKGVNLFFYFPAARSRTATLLRLTMCYINGLIELNYLCHKLWLNHIINIIFIVLWKIKFTTNNLRQFPPHIFLTVDWQLVHPGCVFSPLRLVINNYSKFHLHVTEFQTTIRWKIIW